MRSQRITLQNDHRQPSFIGTVPGRGYRSIPTFSNPGSDSGSTAGEPRPS